MIKTNNRRHCRAKSRASLGVSISGWLMVAIVAAGVAPSNLLAQGRYEQDAVNPQARAMSATARRCVGDASIYAGERQRVQQFFSEYYFPKMTDPSPQGLGKLGKYNTDLFRLYIWPSQNEAMQKDLTDLVVAFAKKTLVNTKYHPAVRLNAVLMLGKLDASYGVDTGPNARPPKPLPEATKLLLQVVKLTKKDPRITPAMMSAALVGLQRHARFRESLPPSEQANLGKMLTALVRLKKPLVEMDEDVHFWIQRQAAGGLAALGSPGTDGRVIVAIAGLASNEEMSLDERCLVAAMLASISTDGVKINGAAVAEPIVRLAADVATSAEEDAAELQKMAIRGRGRMNSQDAGMKRRQHLARLVNLEAALGAIQPIVGDKAGGAIVDVRAAMSPVLAVARNSKAGDIELLIEVKRMAEILKAAADSFGADPAAAAEDDFQTQ